LEFLAGELSTLRRQLGWSQADLGRRLGFGLEQIQVWETGAERIPREVSEELEYLRRISQGVAETISLQAIAEEVLISGRRTQIHRDEVDIPLPKVK